MATVSKRSGSKHPWQVRYRDNAGLQRSEQFTLKADAEARARDVERQRQTGGVVGGARQTVGEFGRDYFRAHRGDDRPATAKGKAYIWNAHVHGRSIAGMRLTAVRPSDVQTLKADMQAAGVGDGSTRKALGLLSQVFDAAVLDGRIQYNPCTAVKRPSGARAGDVKVIAPAGVEAIRAKLDERSALLVSVMAYSGLRPGELRALRWEHVGAKALRVEYACNPDGSLDALKGQSGKRRSVPLCAALTSDLAQARGGADDQAFLFEHDGTPWTKTSWDNWRKRKFLPAVEAAGVNVGRPYELRHSIASLWLRAGDPYAEIAARLGHSVAVLLSTYSHVIADLDPADRRTVDAMIADARRGPTEPR